MFKDFNAGGSLKTDMTFMSNADVPVLALHNQGVLEKNPFTGNLITTEDKNHPLYIALSGGIHLEDPDATTIWLDDTRNFYVHDNIFDEKNWVKAGR
jgi:hypothetical protein